MRIVAVRWFSLCSIAVTLTACAVSPPADRLPTDWPEAAGIWYRRGNDYVATGQLEQAEYAYRQAVREGAGPRAQHNLGLVQMRLGFEALSEARQRLPTDDPVHAETRRFLQTLLLSDL